MGSRPLCTTPPRSNRLTRRSARLTLFAQSRRMRAARPNRHAAEWQVWAALGIVYVVWGSTYLAIRVMVRTMPPLLSGGTRHVIAGMVIFGLLLLWRGRGGFRLRRSELLGGGPGWAGVAILVGTESGSGRVELLSMLMIVGAAVSWSIGTYISKRVDMPHDPLASTGVQMLVGGLGLLAVGGLTGETVHPEQFSAESLLSLGYLIVFGSVLAYTAYTWALIHASVSRVSTYAYVNPVVAVILGGLLLQETIDLTMLIGAAVIIASVWLVIRTEARAPSPAGAVPGAEP